jgi:hypothetical protein
MNGPPKMVGGHPPGSALQGELLRGLFAYELSVIVFGAGSEFIL